MPCVTLRIQPGTPGDSDLTVEVKENTYEYLLTSDAPTIRVSAYLDRDCPRVEAAYAELHVADDCRFVTRIKRMHPGSRTRAGIALPGPMLAGEQLTLETVRTPRA